MTGYVEVISQGLYSSIQDSGRIGYRKYGIPPSGTMDKKSSELANHLLNNPLDAAVMEITLHGPKLLFSVSTQICITGADISPRLNNQSISCNKIINIGAGDTLSFGLLHFGARSYLAVKDGFQTEKIMGSRSYFTPVSSHSTIRKGDRLPIQAYHSSEQYYSTVRPDHLLFTSSRIKCSTGPEFDLLNDEDKISIFESTFMVTKENNRMGYRLEGTPINYPVNYNMLTSSVLPGTVQLTPSGQLIALMQDCQTTGGYPRILQLKQSGINTLSQKKSSDTITFESD